MAQRKPAGSKPAAKRGRPSKYQAKFVEDASRLTMLLGFDIPSLAKFFGVGETTVDRWIKSHPEFRAAIKDARAPADAKVANAMFLNACGFEWEEEQAIKIKTGQYTEAVEIVTVRRKVPPNVSAGIFWLVNRQSMAWRQKPPEDAGDESAQPVVVNMNAVDASKPKPDAEPAAG